MTNEQKSILSIRIVAAIMTVLLGIGIGYLIWHDKPVQIVNKVDKVKVDSLQNVINTLTLQLNNIKEYKVKEKIIYKTQIVKEKEKIYQALDTAARVNVFQKWVVDSSGVQYKTTQVSDTSIAIELKQMDYLTLQQYRYQNTQELLQIYKIGYYNKDSVNTLQKNIIDTYTQLNNSKDAIISTQINENNTMQKQIKQINKELKRERNKTIITGVAGGLITGAITILYITK